MRAVDSICDKQCEWLVNVGSSDQPLGVREGPAWNFTLPRDVDLITEVAEVVKTFVLLTRSVATSPQANAKWLIDARLQRGPKLLTSSATPVYRFLRRDAFFVVGSMFSLSQVG